MEKPESSTGDESNVELEDRDPNSLNKHLQVMWDDVIGEPEGIRSPECAWRLSGHCFRLSRSCCYVFLSVLIAPLLALCFGFTFACLAFQRKLLAYMVYGAMSPRLEDHLRGNKKFPRFYHTGHRETSNGFTWLSVSQYPDIQSKITGWSSTKG
ncbi:hypothetical protein K0M31_001270 [Melipona bicolor]|uniref:Caveolin n=1 Tax=Melipona bicolor TaxID=60889 RepID=A0AA40KXK1_9HYME|nr:hypothetical protein K0M31_001270 [Melipona bicolor]